MNNDYLDIRARIKEPPRWWDEHAVPRYSEFSPDELADIYADECVLLEIRCQGCKRPFLVAMSVNRADRLMLGDDGPHAFPALIESNEIHYGDPPNVGCCPSGPTMSSEPVRVVEYWQLTNDARGRTAPEWKRDPSFERAIRPDWMEEP